MGVTIVVSGSPALASAPVATTTTPVAEAAEGCMVMIVVVVAVGTPTVTAIFIHGTYSSGQVFPIHAQICWFRPSLLSCKQ